MSTPERYLLVKLDDLLMAVEYDLENRCETDAERARLNAVRQHLETARETLRSEADD